VPSIGLYNTRVFRQCTYTAAPSETRWPPSKRSKSGLIMPRTVRIIPTRYRLMLTNKRAHDADKAYGESPPTGPRSEWVRRGGLAGPYQLDAAVGLLERLGL
jgi:hypothetical protein